MKKRTKFLFICFFIIAMSILFFTTVSEIKTIKNLNKNGLLTTGIVIDYKTKISENSDRKKSIIHYPIFEFKTQENQTITLQSNFGTSNRRFGIGERVEIIYDRYNPKTAREASFLAKWFAIIILTVFNLIFLVMFFVVIRKFFSKNKSDKLQDINIETKKDSIIVDNTDKNDPRRFMQK